MAKKSKVSKTQAVRDYPKASDTARPDPLDKQRIAVRAYPSQRPDWQECSRRTS